MPSEVKVLAAEASAKIDRALLAIQPVLRTSLSSPRARVAPELTTCRSPMKLPMAVEATEPIWLPPQAVPTRRRVLEDRSSISEPLGLVLVAEPPAKVLP